MAIPKLPYKILPSAWVRELTWKSGQCFRYTIGLDVDQTFRYYTHGWGLTHKDPTLIVSNGSNRLYFYNPNFKPLGGLGVYDDKGAVSKLNELEYVDGYVLANVWETNRIIRGPIRNTIWKDKRTAALGG